MSPNPYILLRNLFTPRRWFKSGDSGSVGYTEHLHEPVPGTYEYRPGRGWYLIAFDNDADRDRALPAQVIYCRLFGRFMFQDEYEGRKKHGRATDMEGNEKDGVFFRLDDGRTWIHCWDQTGKFVPGVKIQRFVIDSKTGQFRIMRRSDCTVGGRSPSTLTAGSASALENVAGPSRSSRSFVEGDDHRLQARGSVPSTSPSTRPATRPSSSRGSHVERLRNASDVTTPPSVAEPQCTELDAPELQRRLNDLEQP